MVTLRYLSALIIFLTFQTGLLAQSAPENVIVDQYTGQTEIKATRSVILRYQSPSETFHVPKGSILRAWVYKYQYYKPIPEPNANYIKVEELLTTSSATIETNRVDQKKVSYLYFDGLGRQIQSIDVQGSPTNKDFISFKEYDAYGRQPKVFEPYTDDTDNGLQSQAPANEHYWFYKTGVQFRNKVATSDHAYSATIFEASSSNRPIQKGFPGSTWQPLTPISTSHAIKFEHAVNIDGESSGGQEHLPILTMYEEQIEGKNEHLVASSYGQYTSSSIFVKITKDENNREVREYSDEAGKLISKKIQYVESDIQTYDNNDWNITYYVYDGLGRLSIVLQPELCANLNTYLAATSIEKRDLLAKYAFEYRYDERGRLIYKRVPGADPVEMVYDVWDRPVLSRDGEQKAKGKWSFTKYDVFNRAIMTGEFSSSASQSTLASDVISFSSGHSRYEEVISGNGFGYTLNYTFPSGALSIYSITYYDDYSFLTRLNLGSAYNYSGSYYADARGQVTGTKQLVLDSSPQQWLMDVNYYDDKNRLIHTVSDDHLNNKNKTTNTYLGITDRVSISKVEHGSVLVSQTETEYDHRARPLRTWQTMDNNTAATVLMVSNQYNELGQLVEKNLHSTDGGKTFIQSVDYRYNIRGWLQYINNRSLTNDGNTNDDTNDLFGVEFNHIHAIGVGTLPMTSELNGNIRSIKWKTNNLKDPPVEKMYGFRYDAIGRLKDAKYVSTEDGDFWNIDQNMFDEDNISYDRNGNILNLSRRSSIDNTAQNIDLLNYSYQGNQLINVHDNSSFYNSAVSDMSYGFTELTRSTITEYGYNKNGNLTYDLNKGLVGPSENDPDGILYNHLNLPTEIRMGSRKIQYTYSASGERLKKVVKDGSTIISVSDYVGSIQYENSTTVPAFISHPDGRIIKNGTTWEYEYNLTDHLGNVRVVFGLLKDVSDYKATMETELASTEQSQFKNLSSSIRSTDFNHTKPSSEVSLPNESVRLNGNEGKAIGPAKMLQVKNGERVTMEVFAHCPVVVNSNDVIPNLAAAVTSAFSLSVGEAGYQALTDQVPITGVGIPRHSGMPKAYLCYILFNNNYGFVQHGFFSTDLPSRTDFQKLSLDINVPSDGYMYIYVANESNISSANAYFDDLSIVHYRNTSSLQVKQTMDYYPFGLTITPLTFQQKSLYDNDYKFGGKELQDDFNLNWYDFVARMYMPEIGRWGAADPLADQAHGITPFRYSFNNPINVTDPDGMFEYVEGSYGQKIEIGQLGSGSFWESTTDFMGNPTGQSAGSGSSTDESSTPFSVGFSEYSYQKHLMERNSRDGTFVENFGEGLWDQGKSSLKGMWGLATFDGQAWSDFGQGMKTLGDLCSPIPNLTKMQFQSQAIDYVTNIPNMSWGDAGYDFGRGTAIGLEIALTRKIGRLSITTKDGFLFGGINIKAPFNIPVQRFGAMSVTGIDYWGARIGSSVFANRVFSAIKPSWNNLTNYTKGIIPKGTPMKFGIIGPVGLKHLGGSLQFVVKSRDVIKQTSRLMKR